jgi:hypothetical protein
MGIVQSSMAFFVVFKDCVRIVDVEPSNGNIISSGGCEEEGLVGKFEDLFGDNPGFTGTGTG